LDLGVSSDQLDDPERGFSLMKSGPLDMRMNRAQELTAAHLVNSASEEELAGIFRSLGEEPAAGRIARAIAVQREQGPIETTGRLAEIVGRAKGGRARRIHPATKVFQAVRIAVNRELESLERGLAAALELLRPGGRLAVISFHSLEDRMVKDFFRRHAGGWVNRPAGGREWISEKPEIRLITRKPIRPGGEEIERNPRARSAKLRVAEKRG
jgi:16S rRNA (cytosine1402-N4)-methyltransferase